MKLSCHKKNIHAGIKAQYDYYIHSLSGIQKKEKLLIKDIDGNEGNYSYSLKGSEYSAIIKDLNTTIIDKILCGKKMELGRCGSLYIVGCRRNIEVTKDGTLNKKNMGIDWKKTLELWERLYPGQEQQIWRGVNYSFKHIHNKPLVYYDNKFEYKLSWHYGTTDKRPTGQFYYHVITNDSCKKKMRKTIGDTDGTHIANIIYDKKYYDKKYENVNPFVKRINKNN